MGLFDWIKGATKESGHGVDELARRLGLSVEQLRAIAPAYREFTIPKRSGGTRRILAPEPALKSVQRLLLRKLFRRLKVHPAATGFCHGQSIVTNAKPHVGKAVVVKLDLKDFFESTLAYRLEDYLHAIGWNKEAIKLLVQLCTHKGRLPQGAPTSPCLSNLLNYKLDARLAAFAAKHTVSYTRYADDLTFSFATDDRKIIHAAIRLAKTVAAEYDYELHLRRKLQVRRRHDAQLVTGLVVNQRVNLPRATRRWLRAVQHHLATGSESTLTLPQLKGWIGLMEMIRKQSQDRKPTGQ